LYIAPPFANIMPVLRKWPVNKTHICFIWLRETITKKNRWSGQIKDWPPIIKKSVIIF